MSVGEYGGFADGVGFLTPGFAFRGRVLRGRQLIAFVPRGPKVRLHVSIRDLELENVGSGGGESKVAGEAAAGLEAEVFPSPEQSVEDEKLDPEAVFNYIWPRATMILVAALWGTNFAIVKMLDESVRVAASAFARFGLAALALSPWMIGAPKEVLLRGFDIGKYVFLGYYFQTVALKYSTANKIAFLCSLTVVFVPLLSTMFPSKEHGGDEKNQVPMVSILLAISGVALLELSSAVTPSVGDILGFLSTIAFAYKFVCNERALSKYPGSAMALSAAQLATVGGLSAVWYVVDSLMLYGTLDFSGVQVAASDSLVFGSLLYTGLVTTGLTLVLENLSLKRLSAAELSLLVSSEPFFAAAFSAFFLNETLTSQGVLGGFLIFTACLSSSFSTELRKRGTEIVDRFTRWMPGMKAKPKRE
eukprot:CAMPEP_0113969530 /NCGR_PEP_ID=MMETSP0011_2-20120614/10390_1 /TAXON_ID=101924 /ORGANISM="Rhodosorus marinus" /LENGTH=417 /DNA_ID=CAMNT_0000983241 /DNA_START=301 /DNA_END=1554 /DNA_ORIENTATION=+ /assembly_acc=CAM_ASM_000156